MVKQRTKWIHLRVSASERTAWQAKAEAAGLTLADLIRQHLGEARQVGRDPVRRPAARKADPALLTALARIGNNLNQVAKWANTHKSNADAVEVIAALVSIEESLHSLPRPGGKGSGNNGH